MGGSLQCGICADERESHGSGAAPPPGMPQVDLQRRTCSCDTWLRHFAICRNMGVATNAHGVDVSREQQEWWNEADMSAFGMSMTSRLMDTEIFRKPFPDPRPWCQGAADHLLFAMGMTSP